MTSAEGTAADGAASTEGSDDATVQRLVGIARVASELSAAVTMDEVVRSVTEHAARVLGAVGASLLVPVSATTMEVAGVAGDLPELTAHLTRWPLTAAAPVMEAARVGHIVVASGRETLVRHYPDAPLGTTSDRTIVGLPLVSGGRLQGAVALHFSDRREPSDLDRQFLQTVADTCAQALARVSAQRTEQERFAQMSFLSTATAELSRSLDYRETLQRVADLVVPELASWCGIDILEDGHLLPVAVAHDDPAKLALAQQMRERYPPRLDAPQGAHVVARTGVPEIYEDIDSTLLEEAAVDPEHLRLIQELDLRSAMIVPLIAGDRTHGVLTLVRGEAERRYDTRDLAFAEQVAARAAVAIDNAHLHSQTQQVALELQHAVLPGPLERAGDWQVAVHYSSAGRTMVGGDFYDAVPLPDGRLAVFVGDVMGRGVPAAAAMAQVRSALRAYVALDPDPGVAVGRLSAMFEQLNLPQMVTLLYVLLDPAAGTARAVSAGHLPPLAISADGVADRLELPVTPPLGTSGEPLQPADLQLAPTATLLLFTDGVVERRDEDIDSGLERLAHAAGALVDQLSDEALATLAGELRAPDHDDDATLLAVRRRS